MQHRKALSLLMLCMLFPAVYAEKVSFDIHNKDIGFNHSPNPDSESCLSDQTFPDFSTTLYYNSAVGPSIAVNPKSKDHIVGVWQQDRFDQGGGALDVGIARSKDGGKNWKRSVLPLQNCNGGISQRASNPWVSYSEDGKRVYLAALIFNITADPNTNNQEGVVVSVSHDNGKTWSIPHYLAAGDDSYEENFQLLDKVSVTADPELEKYAYVVWDEFVDADSLHANTVMSRTTDGGLTWEDSNIIYDGNNDPGLISNGDPNDNQTINNIIVGLPNGDLLNFMTRIYAKPEVDGNPVTDLQYSTDSWPYQYTNFDIAVIRSTDKGVTWEEQATQVLLNDSNDIYTCGYTIVGNNIIAGNGQLVRAGQFGVFSVAVNPENGYLYVTVNDSRFAASQLPQIALVSSRDGGLTWSAPVKVSRTPSNAPNPQAFSSAVAVDKEGHVGVLYHDFRKSDVACAAETKTNTWFALYKQVSNPNGGSTGIGLDFKKELRVSEHSYIMENGPVTQSGIMTNGDYNSLAALKDDFYALYVQSHKGPFDPAQSIIDDLAVTGVLVLDDNKRTSPFFSKIDS